MLKPLTKDLVILFTLALSIFPGQARAQPSFEVSQRISGFSAPLKAAAKDVNGDGRPDLVVTNYAAGTVAVLLNSSSGFLPAVPYDTGAGAHSVVLEDFNHDSLPDIAVVNAAADSLTILLNIGQGAFGAGISVHTGPLDCSGTPTGTCEPVGVAALDFNLDGELDLAVANQRARTVSMFAGSGTGSFTMVADVATGFDIHCLVARDFDGDGIDDVAVGGNRLSFLFGTGTGLVRARVDIPAASEIASIAQSDLDGDGIVDLSYSIVGTSQIAAAFMNSNGTVRETVLRAADVYTTSVAAGDFDDDGLPDLVAHNDDRASVYLGSAVGYTAPILIGNFDLPQGFAVADFNGDGNLDLAVSEYRSGHLSVLLNQARSVDLAVSASVAGPHLVGDTIAVAVTVQNQGPATSSASNLTISLPPIVTAVPTPGCTVTGATLSCAVGALEPAQSAAIQLSLMAMAAGSGTLTLSINGAERDSVSGNDIATTIIESWPRPSVSVTGEAIREFNNGLQPAWVKVTLSEPTGVPVVLHFESVDGTATANSDYTPASGLFVIPPFATTASLVVSVWGDRLIERSETFNVAFEVISGATAVSNMAVIEIQNDDFPPVLLVHGFLGSPDGRTWGLMANQLIEDGFDVSYWDNRGERHVAGNLKTAALSLSEKIDEVIRRTGATQIDIVAHSMGGLITQSLLTGLALGEEAHDTRVRRFVQIATPNFGVLLTGELRQWLEDQDLPERLKTRMRQMLAGSQFLMDLRGSWSLLEQSWQLPTHIGLKAEDILNVVGTADGTGDGVVLTASATFENSAIRTRFVDRTHSRVPLIGTAGIAEVDSRDHPSFVLTSAFLTADDVNAAALNTCGLACSTEPPAETPGLLQFPVVNSMGRDVHLDNHMPYVDRITPPTFPLCASGSSAVPECVTNPQTNLVTLLVSPTSAFVAQVGAEGFGQASFLVAEVKSGRPQTLPVVVLPRAR